MWPGVPFKRWSVCLSPTANTPFIHWFIQWWFTRCSHPWYLIILPKNKVILLFLGCLFLFFNLLSPWLIILKCRPIWRIWPSCICACQNVLVLVWKTGFPCDVIDTCGGILPGFPRLRDVYAFHIWILNLNTSGPDIHVLRCIYAAYLLTNLRFYSKIW